MDKQTLITEICQEAEVTQDEAKRVLHAFIEITKNTVASGGYIHVKGFGRFYSKYRQPKKAINPHNKEPYILGGKHYPAFKPAIIFKEMVFEGSEKGLITKENIR